MGACATCDVLLGPEGPLARAEAFRARIRGRLEADPGLAGRCAEFSGGLRAFGFPARGRSEPAPRDLDRLLRGTDGAIRLALAARGAEDGGARAVLKHLGLFGLSKDDALDVVLLCALADPEHALAQLADLPLEAEARLAVAQAALSRQPRLDFEAYKSLEVQYLAADPLAVGASQVQRRFEQARAQRSLHARRHLIGAVPGSLMARPEWRFALLEVALECDPFGTLDHFRELEILDPCEGIAPERRLDLLDRVARHGLGLASTHLDLFRIPAGEALEVRLQSVLKDDLIAGSSLLGVSALEGAHHYPFGLGRIEPVLPRRITNAEALQHLQRGQHKDAPPRSFGAAEVGEAAASLQEREMGRFQVLLKSDLAREWKSRVGDWKREVVFGDPGLKVRDILFLLAHALFEEEARFERIYRLVQQSHPMSASRRDRMLLLANRYFFLELLGIHPGLLFARTQRGPEGACSPMEGAGDFQVRALLHAGMSIHLRVGQALFCSTPIAWNILLGQYEGQMDAILQDLVQLFEGFDTLLTLLAPLLEDPVAWVDLLVDALAAEETQLPDPARRDSRGQFLRLTTRSILQRCRGLLNGYCAQALQLRADAEGVSPTQVIQGLRLPRSRTDRLLALLQQARPRREGARAGSR